MLSQALSARETFKSAPLNLSWFVGVAPRHEQVRLSCPGRAGFPPPGEAQPGRYFPLSTTSSTRNRATPPAGRAGGKSVRAPGRAARAPTGARGARPPLDAGANVPGARAVSAPAPPAPRPWAVGPGLGVAAPRKS